MRKLITETTGEDLELALSGEVRPAATASDSAARKVFQQVTSDDTNAEAVLDAEIDSERLRQQRRAEVNVEKVGRNAVARALGLIGLL
jgi:hypothetical protein